MSLWNIHVVVIIWRKSLNIWLTTGAWPYFFLPVLLLNVLVIRRHRPHVIIDTQMTVKHEFKILTSARWQFVVHSIQFSTSCLLKLRTFSLLRPEFSSYKFKFYAVTFAKSLQIQAFPHFFFAYITCICNSHNIKCNPKATENHETKNNQRQIVK